MNRPADIELDLRLQRDRFSLRCEARLPGDGVSAVFGPSGSGKTSLLRAIAGLDRAVEGRIEIAGERWLDSARGLRLPPWRRAVGMVFQEPSLLPHLDVRQNILFAAPRTASADTSAIRDAIELLDLGPLLHRAPDALSGGEQRRVAIARALASQPRLLLLDEPLSGLDPARRREVLPWLARLREDSALPMLYVTHQLGEVLQLADHVLLLEAGSLRASGPLDALLPTLHDVAEDSTECCALVHARVVGHDPTWGLTEVDAGGTRLWLCTAPRPKGEALRLRIEARDVSLSRERLAASSVQNQLRCEIEAIEPAVHPSQRLVRLVWPGGRLWARVTARAVHDLGLAPGVAVWALVKAVAVPD